MKVSKSISESQEWANETHWHPYWKRPRSLCQHNAKIEITIEISVDAIIVDLMESSSPDSDEDEQTTLPTELVSSKETKVAIEPRQYFAQQHTGDALFDMTAQAENELCEIK